MMKRDEQTALEVMEEVVATGEAARTEAIAVADDMRERLAEVCACGDYRTQHTEGRGRCGVCQPLAGPPRAPWDGCHRFRPVGSSQ